MCRFDTFHAMLRRLVAVGESKGDAQNSDDTPGHIVDHSAAAIVFDETGSCLDDAIAFHLPIGLSDEF
jgi:hypothetical protein